MDHSQANKTKVPSRNQRSSLTYIYLIKKIKKQNQKLRRLNMELAHEIKNGNSIYTCKLAHVLFLREAYSYVGKLNVGMRVHLRIARKTKWCPSIEAKQKGWVILLMVCLASESKPDFVFEESKVIALISKMSLRSWGGSTPAQLRHRMETKGFKLGWS